MRSKAETAINTIWLLLVRITLVVGTAYFLWRVKSVLVTVILAVVLTYLLLPAVDFLCTKRLMPFKKKTNRLIASILVFLAFFAVTGIATKVLFNPFKEEASKVIANSDDYYKQAQAEYKQADTWYVANVPQDMRDFFGKDLAALLGKLGFNGGETGADKKAVGTDTDKNVSWTGVDKQTISSALKSTPHWFGSIVELLMIPVLAFYFILDSKWLKRELVALLPPRRTREAMQIIREAGQILQSYVIGQLILCVLAGVVTWAVLHALGVQYALVLAVLAGLTRAIPVIGPIVSGIPICILGAFQSTTLGVSLLIFVIILHFTESKFVMPILIGDRMKLHPAVVLIALLIGAEFFGLLGMFLSAPVAAMIRELLYRYVVRPRRTDSHLNGKESKSSTLVSSERI